MVSLKRPSTVSLLLACVMAAACSSSSPPKPTTPAVGTGGGAGGGSGGSIGEPVGGSGGSMPGTGGSTGGMGGAPTVGTGGNGGSSTVGTGGSMADAGPPADGGSTQAGGGGGAPLGPPPAGMHVVYVLGVNGDPSSKSLVGILNAMHDSHGIVVKMAGSATPAAMMADASLIIIGPNSSMFNGNHPAPDLKTTPIPVMISKDGHTDEVGLGTVQNTDAHFNTIDIIRTDHPLAAGLTMGTKTVLTTTNAQRLIRFSDLGPDAIKIAVTPVDTTSFAIVAYEKGGTMANSFKAPGKRLGFFWHRPAAVTPDGEKLFRAAVDWLLRP
jgi:hypothetical protein